MSQISESTTNIIAQGTKIEGKVTFEDISRVHGILVGELHAVPGSTVILSESAIVTGDIHADTLMIDGFVKGDVYATTKVVISGTGRVVGNIQTRSLTVEFGAYFEGRCSMEGEPGSKTALSTGSTGLKPPLEPAPAT